MNSLPNKLMNHGTSVNNTLRQVAGSLGTAIIIAVSNQVQTGLTPSLGFEQATLMGIDIAFGVSTVICLAAAIITIVLVKNKTQDPAQNTATNEHNPNQQS
ncbi:MAG: multidrug MFS transporter, partial [Eggerthellaceae bacterium]|nr:multidrug MFS transporter [Eggerthellaceae bacterium]